MIRCCWCCRQSLQNLMIRYLSVLVEPLSTLVSYPSRLTPPAGSVRSFLRCTHRVSPCCKHPRKVRRCAFFRSTLPDGEGKEIVESEFAVVVPSLMMTFYAWRLTCWQQQAGSDLV